MENKRIPFDWEKYQSGEFEITCRNGIKPEQITYNPKAYTYVVAAWVKDVLRTFTEKGVHTVHNDQSDYDLFLIPKPKKFQAWVNLYSNGAAIPWSNEDLAKQYEQWNNGLFVKTILIEWEG